MKAHEAAACVYENSLRRTVGLSNGGEEAGSAGDWQVGIRLAESTSGVLFWI